MLNDIWAALVLILGVSFIGSGGASPADAPSPQHPTGSFDHIRILVRDIAGSRVTYRDSLGFSFPDPKPIIYAEGSAHDISDLPDGSYLELIGITDRNSLVQARPWIVKFLDTHEGAHSIGLRVDSAQSMSDRLRAAGVRAPVFKLARVHSDAPPVLLVTPQLPHLPDGAIFFLEYPPKKAGAEPAPATPVQTNGTMQIRAVWIVVKDLDKASEDMRLLGFPLIRSVASRVLGARGREFSTGRGDILLLRAIGTAGPAARFWRARGEGLMGFSLVTASLKRSRAIVENGIGHSLQVHRDLYGRSILIPPEKTSGAWIEIEEE